MDAGGGSQVRLIQKKVTSLQALEEEHGPYTAVVAAAGAANGVISEIGRSQSCIPWFPDLGSCLTIHIPYPHLEVAQSLHHFAILLAA